VSVPSKEGREECPAVRNPKAVPTDKNKARLPKKILRFIKGEFTKN